MSTGREGEAVKPKSVTEGIIWVAVATGLVGALVVLLFQHSLVKAVFLAGAAMMFALINSSVRSRSSSS